MEDKREFYRDRNRGWRAKHGKKRVHARRWGAARHILSLALTGEDGVSVLWEMMMYRCDYGPDFRQGRTGVWHWHVGHRRTRRERGRLP